MKPVTAELRRVTLKRSHDSLESRESKKRKSREHECKLCSAGTFISHYSETSLGATAHCPGSLYLTRHVGPVGDSMDPAAS